MAEEDKGSSPKTEPQDLETKEDAETRAARRELKQSSISDAPPPTTAEKQALAAADDLSRPETPADDDTDLKEQVASPKKKRAHDQLDREDKAVAGDDAKSVASIESAKDRTERSEPEKKRPRDGEASETEQGATAGDASSARKSDETNKGASDKKSGTSANAFAASAFGKLSTGASPFASLGGASTGFGSSPGPKLSSFAKPETSNSTPTTAEPAAAPKLTFGGSTGVSPFAGLGVAKSNGFGSSSGLGSGVSPFGSALSAGSKLTGFAAPGGKPLAVGKAAKPFGAPDSEDEEDEEEDDAEEGQEAVPEEAERALSPEKDEEKKKIRLQKIEVDAGETGEITMVSVRAKMFYHDKEAGWKERGAGMLKINVPQSCVDFNEDGTAVPGSFDASGLETDEEEAGAGPKICRLLMRQDQTHRVILNTVIVPAMKFQEKASLKSVGILFTAFEGATSQPVSVTMKMSAANAKLFMNEIGNIQRELQSN